MATAAWGETEGAAGVHPAAVAIDVEAGYETILQGKRRKVLEVRVCRSSQPAEDEPVVKSGREWMLQAESHEHGG